MGLVGQYVDSIKSNFSNAGTSLSKVADKPSDGSILGRIFGGLKNLGDAAIHATAGLAKIALPIAAGVALVSLGPVGWIGLGALGLSLLGGDPQKPATDTKKADEKQDAAKANAPKAPVDPKAPNLPPAPTGTEPAPKLEIPKPTNPPKTDKTEKVLTAEQATQADKAAASSVDDLIGALPKTDEITIQNKEQIVAARTAYDKLSEAQRILLKKSEILDEAENIILTLE
jgi:hypothetical protein